MVSVRQSDIARKLHVSRVSVSKALRNHPDISVALKKKIGETARKMGYVPNLIARQLNSRRTYTIGVVVPDLENSFFSFIVDTMIDYATEHNYHVILTVSREKQSIEKQNIENLIGMRVDGLLICLSQETTDQEVFKTAGKMKIPMVFFDRAFDDLRFPRVVFNDRAGALNALTAIIKEGYTRIAHFAGYSTTSIGRERIRGFTEGLKKNRLHLKKEWIIESGFEQKDGYESFRKLDSSGTLPEIIFTANDRIALGAYKAANEAGLRVPEDIGIFGYGFAEITDFFDPQLTVINQDPRKIGSAAIKLLLDQIENNTGKIPDITVIEEEFLWRKSVKRKIKNK